MVVSKLHLHLSKCFLYKSSSRNSDLNRILSSYDMSPFVVVYVLKLLSTAKISVKYNLFRNEEDFINKSKLHIAEFLLQTVSCTRILSRV
jgi:hypothetical protein